jgi:hypothetical protein
MRLSPLAWAASGGATSRCERAPGSNRSAFGRSAPERVSRGPTVQKCASWPAPLCALQSRQTVPGRGPLAKRGRRSQREAWRTPIPLCRCSICGDPSSSSCEPMRCARPRHDVQEAPAEILGRRMSESGQRVLAKRRMAAPPRVCCVSVDGRLVASVDTQVGAIDEIDQRAGQEGHGVGDILHATDAPPRTGSARRGCSSLRSWRHSSPAAALRSAGVGRSPMPLELPVTTARLPLSCRSMACSPCRGLLQVLACNPRLEAHGRLGNDSSSHFLCRSSCYVGVS